MDIQRHLKTKISRHGPDGEAGNLSSIPVWATKLVLTNAVVASCARASHWLPLGD